MKAIEIPWKRRILALALTVCVVLSVVPAALAGDYVPIYPKAATGYRVVSSSSDFGGTNAYRYDDAGYLVEVTRTNTIGKTDTTINMEYDSNGNCTRYHLELSIRDGRNHIKEQRYFYNEENQMIRMVTADGYTEDGEVTPLNCSLYVYNDKGQIVGCATATADGWNKWICHEFDPETGAEKDLTYSDYDAWYEENGEYAEYVFMAVGEDTSPSFEKKSTFEYNSAGQITYIMYGFKEPMAFHLFDNEIGVDWAGQKDLTYEGNSRFEYDSNGNLIKISSESGNMTQTTYTYEYNANGYLTGCTYDYGSYSDTHCFSYDAYGNRVEDEFRDSRWPEGTSCTVTHDYEVYTAINTPDTPNEPDALSLIHI